MDDLRPSDLRGINVVDNQLLFLKRKRILTFERVADLGESP
jgi:hypothetical protein